MRTLIFIAIGLLLMFIAMHWVSSLNPFTKNLHKKTVFMF